MRSLLLLACAALAVTSVPALAQRGHIINRILPRRAQPPQPVLTGIDALRADFLARSGSDTVYFGGESGILSAPAKATLAAQAMWLRQNPQVVVRIEGHASTADTRDHALALGARRAEEVRDYLVLLGVPAFQLSAVSMGKERPMGANARAVTILVR